MNAAFHADVVEYEVLCCSCVYRKVVGGTSRIMTQVMTQKGYVSSNLRGFGMERCGDVTDGIPAGMNGVGPARTQPGGMGKQRERNVR